VGQYTSQPYAGARDLPALIRFAQETTAARSPGAAYYHPGDFVWQLFDFDASRDVGIWRDTGASARVAACAIFEPPLTYEFAITPDIEDERALMMEIFGWAEGRRAVATDKGDVPIAYQSRGSQTVSTSALISDELRIQALIEDGYALHAGKSWRNVRPFDGTLPPMVLPEGAAFRTISDGDFEARAELHRDAWSVWGTSTFSVERYRRLRAAPLYDPDLDVVLTVDGRMASYCICWLDEANKIGLFEPVGTCPDMARRGYGRLVLHEAFRRLRARGMTSAIVATSDVNQPAKALYASGGFKEVEEVLTYVKADPEK